MSSRSESKKVACMALAGLALLLAGCLLDRWMPINKSLWTSTFSIFMAGLALVCLAFFHWLIDVAGYSKWAMPLIIPGLNPITLYVLSPKSCYTSLRSVNMVTIKGKDISCQLYMFRTFCVPVAEARIASLLYAFGIGVLSMFLVAWIMWRRRIFIKV